MSADAVRRLLGSLQDDPENEGAWGQLEEKALSGELAASATEVLSLLEAARARLAGRGEHEAVARLLETEALVVDADAARKAAVHRERARVLEEELLDDKGAVAALEAVRASDPQAAEAADRVSRKKDKWKDIANAFLSHARETPEPAQIAQHLTSAAAMIQQYKGKGRDKDVDQYFAQALSVDPSNLRALRAYERILRKREKWDEAAALLEKGAEGLSSGEDRTGLLLRAARLHATRRRDLAGTERAYREVLAKDPANADGSRLLVALLSEQNRLDDLVKVYEWQLSLPGNEADPGLLVQAAMTHWRMRNDAASAAPFLARLAKAQPEHGLPKSFFAEHPHLAPADSAAAPTPAAPAPAPEAPATAPEPSPAAAAEPVAAQPAAEEKPAEPAPAPVVSAPAPAPAEPSRPASIAPPPADPAAPAKLSAKALMAIDLAEQFEANNQMEKAIDAWKSVLRLEPTAQVARDSLVRLYSAAGRWNLVVELYRQEIDALGGAKPGGDGVVTYADRKLKVLRAMIEVYRDKMGLEPMVVQTYNAILGIAPGDRESLVALGKSYEKLGRWADVIKVLEQQAEHTTEPSEKIELLRRTAQLWIERFNNANNATKPLEQILLVDPANAAAIAELKDLYGKRRAWRPLFEVLRREAATLSGDAKRDALVELARLAAEKLSAPAESMGLWREALALDPKTPGALDALEKLTEREKDFAGLAEVLEQRVQETDDAEARVNVLMKLGSVYGERLSNTPKSIEAWRRVLEVKPGHNKALRVLREAYTSAGAWDDLEGLFLESGDLEGLVEALGKEADRSEDPATRVALSFRAARVYEEKLNQPGRAFRSYERVLGVDSKNLQATRALVPLYLEDEKWPRLAQLYEVLLEAVPAGDVDGALDLLFKLRELASTRLADRAGALKWSLRAYKLRPEDSAIEVMLERAAADHGAWKDLVEAFDARAAGTEDAAEKARLRDKAGALEADRLGALDAAIARYQRAREAAPSDAHVVSTLEALLRRAEKWTELRALYDSRLAAASDASARRELLLEVAQIEERNLRDPLAASQRYRKILEDFAKDETALEALSRLAEEGGRWEELAVLLAQRRDEAQGAPRAELAFKLGQLRIDRLEQAEQGIESLREVLALVPHHPAALAALEALLRTEKHRVVAAGLLAPELRAIEQWSKLAWVQQILLDAATERSERRRLTLELSSVYGEQLSDPRLAFELVRGILAENQSDEELADAVSTLAERGQWFEELAEAFAKIARAEDVSGETRVAMARRTAAVYDEKLGRPEAAEPFHRLVVDGGATDAASFNALRLAYQGTQRWQELRALYALWVERTPEVAGRVALLTEEATLVEEVLEQPDEAIEVYRKIHAIDPASTTALRPLDRLLSRQKRWAELVALFTLWMELEAELATELRYRRGEVLERELGEGARALEDFKSVVAEEPAHAGARQGLERIVATRAELRLRAGAVLEGLYENDGDKSSSDHVRMLLVRLEGTEDAAERSALYRRVAELRESKLSDAAGAFDAACEALLAAPGDEGLRAEVLRLAAVASAYARAAEVLERCAADNRSEPVRGALLGDVARLYDEQLGDLAQAERSWRRLLQVAGEDTETVLTCASALERIYTAQSNFAGLVDALLLRARSESDAEVRRELFARAGELQELELRDAAGAIRSQQARLEIDPTDRAALRALARLHEAQAQWPELVQALRTDANLATDGAEQKALQVRAAQVLAERVGDAPGAITLYAEVLATFGPDRSLHAALASLYEKTERWSDLLEVLAQDLTVAESEQDRLVLIVRMAELRRTRLADLSKAVEGYQEALGIDPAQAQARAALDGLLTNEEPGIALAAARALSPVLEAEQSYERLVGVLDRIAVDTEDTEEKQRVLSRASSVCEDGLNDAGRAFGFAARELRASLSEPDLRPRVEHLEHLAERASLHRALADTLREVSPDLLDADLQIDTYMKVAQLSQGPLAEPAQARQWYEKALEQRPDFLAALDALERLHEGGEAWAELQDALRRKVDLATEDAVRRDLLRKQARIAEEKQGDKQAASRFYESILELGHDGPAATSLERLYGAQERWQDLATLLENQLGLPNADVVELHYRLGGVHASRLEDPERGVEHFESALRENREHVPTIQALEQLAQARPDYAAKVAEILEPIYLGRMDWPKVIGAIEARVAAETDVHARKELLSRLGQIYEENLTDLDRALATYARVFREDVADRASWELVARLARHLGRQDRQAEIYASALGDVSSDDDATAQLAYETAQLYDRLDDTQKARTFYRRALAFDASREEVFSALEALLTRESAYPELLALYNEAAGNSGDPEEQKRYYYKIAHIEEVPQKDLAAAVTTWRKVLEVDPTDARAAQKLDELLTRTERWKELAEHLEQRINEASESEERCTLRFRLGQVRAQKLSDPEGAIDAMEAIVQERKDHREAIAGLEALADAHVELRGRIVEILEPLYRDLDDWNKLIVVLNVRLSATQDPMERGALLREIAQLRESRARDTQGAFAAFANAFVADPGDGEARAELERLAAAQKLWDALVQTYERAAGSTSDTVVKADLLKAIAEVHDTKREDPRAAIAAYERLYALDDGQVEALDALQSLHVLLSDWEGLVSVLERKVERSSDDEARKGYLHEIGEYQRDFLGNEDAAVSAFKRALELDSMNGVALLALDDLYSARNEHAALGDVLKQRLDIESEPADRSELALRLGRLSEGQLKNPQAAIEAYRRALDDNGQNKEALAALDRLFQATGAHDDLLENLRTQAGLASDEATRNGLRLRIGALLCGPLSDRAGALEVYRELLASDPTSAEGVRSVRELANREEQRDEAVAILEPIFRNSQKWNELIDVLEVKIAGMSDNFARRDEMRGLAQVLETGLGDPGRAFGALRRGLHEDNSHSETVLELERLAAATNRWEELVSVLEEEAGRAEDPTVTRDLAVRAARLAEARLQDDARAVRSYRKALEQADDEQILEALDQVYVRNQQWREVAEVLERRVALAGDAAALDPLEVRIAELRERSFSDAAGALSAYRNVLDRTPSHPASLAGGERLVQDERVRADAIELLEQAYTTLDDPRKLAWLLELRVAAVQSVSDRVRLLQDLARLREERLNDPSGAMSALVDAFKADPREESLLGEVERLAPVANGWERVRGVVEDAVAAHAKELDGAFIAQLNLRAAGWYRGPLGDNAAAEARLRAAQTAEPENSEVLEGLEALLRVAGREKDLVATLRRRAEVDMDTSIKRDKLREAASLAEKTLQDLDLAADLTAAQLEVDDSDLDALEGLARLRKEQGRFADVAELQTRRARLVDDPALATRLRKEVAELYAGPINDLNKAVTAWRELLDFDPSDDAARTAIEGIFERLERWKDLDEALRARVDNAVTSEERNATRLRLARLAETRFKKDADAVDWLRQVLDETPTHAEAGADLERLYSRGKRWSDLSELLERRAQDYADAGNSQGELAALVRIGELNERELKNGARAVELYERVLERDANNVGALGALARLHEAASQWDRASEMLSRAAELAVPGAEGAEVALRLAAVRSDKLKDEPGAEAALRRALALEPANAQAIEKLKAMAVKRGDVAMQVAMLEHEVGVLADAPKKVALYKQLATLARDKQQAHERAAGYLESARALAPEDKELLLPLVDAYLAAGRQRDAVPVIEKIIQSFAGKRSKELATWHHRLGQAHEALGDNAAALTQLDSAFKIDLTSVPILRDLGLLSYKTGDLDRAQKTFRALLLQRIDATSGITKADVYFYLGDTLRQQNDNPKAINMLERALEADKTHARASELLKQLKGG